VQSLVKWSDIAVRAVDKFAGERVSMRVKYPCLMENLYDRYSSACQDRLLGHSILP
jgi:hypothetical protein